MDIETIDANSRYGRPDYSEVLNAKNSLKRGQFISASKTMDELLYAAEGIQELGALLIMIKSEKPSGSGCNAGFLIETLGRHVQLLRNKAAKELEPIYKTFDAEAIDY